MQPVGATRRGWAATMLALSVLACPVEARSASPQAESGAWPTRPLRVVVPFPPGGSSDVIARLTATRVGESLRQPVVVDSRPGAGTSIGNAIVARATPDGHTLLLADTAFAASSAVLQGLPYDALRDFAPVVQLAVSAQYLYAATGRFADAKALIETARARPGRFALGSGGNGTTTHFMVELFARSIGTAIVHVPYKGSAPALTDAAAGQVEGAFSSYPSAAALIASGRLQPLAIAAQRRHPSQPSVPTFAELGAKDLVVDHWWGVIGPAGIPAAVVERLNAVYAQSLGQPEVRERLVGLAADARAGTAAQFRQLITADIRRFSAIAREAGIRAD